MKLEYLIFNVIVMTGPLIFGSIKKFYFMDRWKEVLISVVIIAIPFMIWDSLVTDKYWMFNPEYTIDFRLANLPVEEWLFFFTIPFACLFTWEMIIRRSRDSIIGVGKILHYIAYILPILGIWLFWDGKQYTGLVLVFLSLGIFLDNLLNTDLILQKRFYLYLIFIIFFTLIFNGYLTSRPVVLYDEAYLSGFRIFTIPIEDFGYGISLLFMCTILYEKFRRKLR